MIALINETLKKLVPENFLLREMALYSLLSAGKRIRPLLVIRATQMAGAPLEKALYPACALEFLHTYSLIHDDLPCMDDDDLRRGQPTLHRKYDEATAILTGDFLLTHSFHILANAPHLNDSQRVKLIQTLSHHAGAAGLIEGQALDLSGGEEIQRLHALKTACLFQTAMEFAAIISNVESSAFGEFGYHYGLLFQALDDLKDGDSPLGEHKAKEVVEVARARCKKALHALNLDSSYLTHFLEFA